MTNLNEKDYIMPEPIVEENVFTTEEILEMKVEGAETLWREISTANYLEEATYILSTMTGKRILEYIEEISEVRMPYSDKSKKTLIVRGSEILAKYLETQDQDNE